MSKLKVAFIGTGLMGEPMARNILKKGFPLVVYNRTFSKVRKLQKEGAIVAATPEAAAADADIVITMVTSGADVDAVLFGKQGAAGKMKRGAVVVDMSTIGPSWAVRLAGKLEDIGVDFLDAPVTGSTPGATSGTLTIFVGGKKQVLDKALPVLQAMGKNIHHVGGVGLGQSIKLINNHLIAVSVAAVAEAMMMADNFGLPRKKVAEILKTVPAMSGMMNLKIPNYVNEEFPLLFSTANLKKDLELALEEAATIRQKLGTLDYAFSLYRNAADAGMEGEDFSKVIKIIEKK